MKESNKEEGSDTASTVETACSSEHDVEQLLQEVVLSPKRRLTLSDAKIALTYVQDKLAGTDDPTSQERHKSSANTYSTFHRPEISMIDRRAVHFAKDASPVTEAVPVKTVKFCTKSTRRRSKIMCPPPPPTKPPPLQVEPAPRKYTGIFYRRSTSPSDDTDDDGIEDDASDATQVEIANMSDVAIDIERYNDPCASFTQGS